MYSENNKERKTIFITGVNGFIGSHLARKLSKDCNIVGVDMKEGEFANIVSDFGSLKESDLNGVDIVVHLAAAFEGDKNAVHKVNVDDTKKLLETCRKSGVKRFIFASTGGVFQKNKNDYIMTKKIAGEIILAEKSMETCVLYLFFPYGPGQREPRLIPRLINKIKRREQVSVNENNGPRLSFTYIDDLVDQISRLCFTDKLEREVIVSGKSEKIGEVIDLMGKMIGEKPIINRSQNVDDVAADNINEIVNYKTTTGIEEGLRKTILSMKNS